MQLRESGAGDDIATLDSQRPEQTLWGLTQRLGTEEAEMKIVGCDLHAKLQSNRFPVDHRNGLYQIARF